MTLTKRGRDYLKATVITGLLAGLAGPPAAAALAFSLSFMAGASLVLSWLSVRRARLEVGVARIRVFKGESRTVAAEIASGSSRWTTLSSVSFRPTDGLDAIFDARTAGGPAQLTITPRLAGRFGNLVAIFEEVDALGLFAYRKEAGIAMVVESLPAALRTPPEPLTISRISIGENPAGAIGAGQELFAVSEYQTGQDPRDILWKRAARMTDDRLPMRVREANVRKVVRIGLAVRWRTDEERVTRADTIAEALAQMCKDMLLLGTTIELEYPAQGRAQILRISGMAELADALVGAWSAGDGTVDPIISSRGVDLLVMGSDDLEEVSRQAQLRPGRVLLIGSAASPGLRLPRGAVASTDRDHLRTMAAEVLAR